MSINATVDETTYEGIDTIQTGGKTITLEEVGGETIKYMNHLTTTGDTHKLDVWFFSDSIIDVTSLEKFKSYLKNDVGSNSALTALGAFGTIGALEGTRPVYSFYCISSNNSLCCIYATGEDRFSKYTINPNGIYNQEIYKVTT